MSVRNCHYSLRNNPEECRSNYLTAKPKFTKSVYVEQWYNSMSVHQFE